jgi:hypothetical protein
MDGSHMTITTTIIFLVAVFAWKVCTGIASTIADSLMQPNSRMKRSSLTWTEQLRQDQRAIR